MSVDWSPNVGDAFSNPDVYFGDFLRFLTIILGCILIGGVVGLSRRVGKTRRYGLIGFAIAAFVAVGTEAERLGTIVTWRLFFNILFITLGLIFIWRTYKGEQ